MTATATLDREIVELGRDSVSTDIVEFYRENGFVKVPNLLTRECAAAIREEALIVAQGGSDGGTQYRNRLTQQVNVWQTNEILKQVVFSKGIASIAESLTGVRLRLWHDHLLSKRPHNNEATEWHQDQPYWPFLDSPKTISVWIALQDTPAEMGCMSFIPGSQRLSGLKAQNLSDSRSLYSRAPELEFEPKMQLPLKAGDATFHNGLCGHMANPNITDHWRCAMVTIYTEDGTRYHDRPHIVTDTYKNSVGDLNHGDILNQEWFPLLTD